MLNGSRAERKGENSAACARAMIVRRVQKEQGEMVAWRIVRTSKGVASALRRGRWLLRSRQRAVGLVVG